MIMPDTYVVTATNGKVSALPLDGGRYWTISTADTDIADATSGDLVVYGDLVGVAVADYDDTNEEIVIDTEGGYELPVNAQTSATPQVNAAIEVGDWLFYDTTNEEINTGPGIAVGQAMEAVTAGETDTIGIRMMPLASHEHGDETVYSILSIPVSDLSAISATDELLTEFTPGFAGTIVSMHFVVGLVPVTTGSKDIDLVPHVEAAAVTGGVLTLLSASLDTTGAVVDATEITAGNEFDADESISIVCSEATAAFAEGNGTILVVLSQTHDHAA